MLSIDTLGMAYKPKAKYLEPKISNKKTNSDKDSLVGPRGIAQGPDSDLIYIADAGLHRVHVFSSNLEQVFSFGDRKTLSTPAGLYVVDNILYVCNWGAHTLALFTLDGDAITHMRETHSSNGKEELTQPIGVTYDKQQNSLFVCDYGGDKIKRYNDLPHIFAHISKPFDVNLTDEFVIVVTGDYMCLHFFDKGGDLLKSVLSSNQGEQSDVGNPSFFGIDDTNTIWLSDYRRHCICHIDMNGKILRKIGTVSKKKGGLFYNPTGLLLDKRGFLISACVRDTKQVQAFDIKHFR